MEYYDTVWRNKEGKIRFQDIIQIETSRTYTVEEATKEEIGYLIRKLKKEIKMAEEALAMKDVKLMD